MIDISLNDMLWVLAGLLLLGFGAIRLQRAFFNLLIDRDGAAKELIRRS